MTASDTREPRRYLTLLAVLAFHLALIMALAMSSKTLRQSIPMSSPIELLFLPPAPATTSRARPNSLSREKAKAALAAPSAITIPPPVVPTESAEPPIDWANEAQEVAAAAAPSPEFRSFDRRSPSESKPPSKSIFDEPPAHHAGEQFRTDDGRRAVFVSDNCYQISHPFASPTALENGMSVQTYCIGKSNKPRGDLFDQLPAYQKYHPSQ
jgi:hypothetical protein